MESSAPHASAPSWPGPSRAAEARALRRRALGSPDGVAVDPGELVERLAPPLPADADAAAGAEAQRERRRFAASVLAQHGIRAEPPLTDDAAGPVRLRATEGFAVQGAVGLGVLATAIGYLAYWPYGLGLAVATVLAVALLARRFAAVDRAVPAWVPRGRTLGALVAAAALALAVLFVVLPVRAGRLDDSRAASAAGLVQAADAAVGRGALPEAERLLGEAASVDPRHPALEAVRARVIAARVVEQLDARRGGGG
jgi:hypothetical protein